MNIINHLLVIDGSIIIFTIIEFMLAFGVNMGGHMGDWSLIDFTVVYEMIEHMLIVKFWIVLPEQCIVIFCWPLYPLVYILKLFYTKEKF